jgi:Flp pilus assembly protein TadG
MDMAPRTTTSTAPHIGGTPRARRRIPRIASERGQALVETAIMLPILLLVCVGIFEFGRAFQTWQVLTNAAREGARIAILPNATTAEVQARVVQYVTAGQLPNTPTVTVDQKTITVGTGTAATSMVTVNYPFSFIMLNWAANLVVNGSTLGGAPLNVTVSAEMRNESQ